MTRRSPLLVATLASLAVGAGLMVPFEGPLVRAVGVAALIAFIVCGLFLIADPSYLDGDD